MRKITVLILSIFCLLGVPAHAQLLKVGVSGGAVLKQMEISSEALEKANWNGWFVGPTVELNLPLGFKVDGSAQYSHSLLQLDEQEMKVDCISLPVNLKHTFTLAGVVGLFISGGYQWDLNIKGKDGDGILQTAELQKNSRSINVGAGVRLLNHIQVGAYYNIPQNDYEGKLNEQDAQEQHLKLKNSWRISAMILF